MWSFNNVNLKKLKASVIAQIESIYLKTNPIENPNIRNKSEVIYDLVIKTKLSKKQYTEISVLLEKLEKVKNNNVLTLRTFGEIEKIVKNRKYQMLPAQINLIENESLISQKNSEFSQFQKELDIESKSIEESLKMKNKFQYLNSMAKKKTILQKILLLQKDIERVISKSSSIELADQAQESDKVTERLKQQVVDVTGLTAILDKIKQNSEEIKTENDEISDLIDDTVSEELSFERAREQFLFEDDNDKNIEEKEYDKAHRVSKE